MVEGTKPEVVRKAAADGQYSAQLEDFLLVVIFQLIPMSFGRVDDDVNVAAFGIARGKLGKVVVHTQIGRFKRNEGWQPENCSPGITLRL